MLRYGLAHVDGQEGDNRLQNNGDQQRLESELHIVNLLSCTGEDDQQLTFESTHAINTLHDTKVLSVIARMREIRCALCPEVAIIILLGRVHLFLLLRWLRRQHMDRVLVRRVDDRLCRRHCHLDRVLSFVRLDDAQVRTDLGIALRAPRNIAV